MWTSVEPNCNNWEPVELQKLKHKLAYLSCKCTPCEKAKFHRKVLIPTQNDKQVQVEEPKCGSFDRYTQVNPETKTTDHNHLMNSLRKDVLCSSCFLTMNFLRGGALWVLKDEETETKPDILYCDKSTGKCVKAIQKSTSFTNNVPVEKFSNLTLYDLVSETSSELSDFLPLHEQKRSPHQVKFLGINVEEHPKEQVSSQHCMCMKNFIDSIRPPLPTDTFF